MSNIYTGPGQGSRITQQLIFKQIWTYSDKRSYVSGLHLRSYMGTNLFLNCFAHVLPKGMNQFPYFKYYAGNIRLLTPGEHGLWDQGTEEARISYALDVKTADWDKLKALEVELKELYKKHFPTTKGIIIGYKYSAEEQLEVIRKLNKEYFESLIKKK